MSLKSSICTIDPSFYVRLVCLLIGCWYCSDFNSVRMKSPTLYLHRRVLLRERTQSKLYSDTRISHGYVLLAATLFAAIARNGTI